MIVSVSTTQSNASILNTQAVIFGVDSEITHRTDPQDIRFELTGDPMKIAHVMGRTRARLIKIYDAPSLEE